MQFLVVPKHTVVTLIPESQKCAIKGNIDWKSPQIIEILDMYINKPKAEDMHYKDVHDLIQKITGVRVSDKSLGTHLKTRRNQLNLETNPKKLADFGNQLHVNSDEPADFGHDIMEDDIEPLPETVSQTSWTENEG